VDDELTRLRSMLRNAHQQPRVNGLKKLVVLIARKFGAGRKRAAQSNEAQKTNKQTAA
jgi:hypothetical protein